MNENQKFIYDQLIGKGIEAGTPEEFANGIKSKEGAQWAYDQLSNDVDLGDFDTFYGAIYQQPQMPTAEKQYVAPVLGGKQPEQAPQENILPDYKAMDAARTMTPAETMQTLNQGVPGVTRIGDTNISHLQTDMLMNEKFGGGYKDTSTGRTEEVTPVGEMETGVELVGAPFNPDEEERRTEPEHIGHQIADTWNSISAGAGDFFKGTASYAELFSRNMEDLGIPGISDLYGVYADGLGNARKFFDRDAAKSRALVSNYDGKTYDELWKEGRYTDAVAHVFNKSAESIPITVASMGGMALGVPSLSALALFAPSAGNAYDEVRDRTDMTEFQKQLNANTIGVLEAATEYFGDKVIVGWLGDIFKKGGERLLKTKVAGPLRKIINDALKSNSLLIPPAIEGIEEVVNSVGQNMVDYFTGKTKVYKPFEGTFDSFVHGFAGGSQFAAVGAGKMAYDQGVEYVKGFEAKTNFNHSRKEYERLMSENGYAPADIQEIETQLIAATPEEAQKMIGQLVQNMDGAVIELENGQFELHEAFTQPLVDLYTSGKQLEHRSKKLQTKVQEFNQRAEQYVTDNLNPDMNALVFAEFQGQPVRVVSGVVQMKDKEIDTEVSTPEIYIETQDGIRIIPPQLLDAQKGLRIIPAQQAVQEIAQQAAEPIVAQHENEEVRPYNEGEIVRAEIAGSPVLGTIAGKTEQGYTIRDAQGMMIQIQPRQIINEDNLEGVDNESVVEYRDQSGAIRTGVVTDIHSERVQGYAYIDDQRIPFSDILGLKTDEVVEEQPQNVGSAPVANSNLSETQETQAGATQDAEQTVQAQYPVTTKGELDFDNFTPEQLFSYTAEQYGEEAAIEDVKVSIAGLETQLSKKKKAFEKMGMKERVKARAEISKIEAEIEEFSNLIPTAPVESAPPAVESAPVTQESAPATQVSAPVENTPSAKKRRAIKDGAIKNTTGRPQWLVNKVRRAGEPKNLRELIMHQLIFGVKLRWNDIVSENKSILSRGLGGEYRYADSERTPRANSMMGYVGDSGMTPEQFAHKLWESNAFEEGQFEDIPLTGYDTQQILDEILDVVNTYPTVTGMARDLEEWAEKIEQDEKDYFDAIMEMEHEDGLPMAEEFEMFVDNIPQESIDNSLRAANFTPEQLIELFEFLNNVYENDEQGGSRGTKEDAETSGNNESGIKSQEGRSATSEGTTNQRGDSGSSPADQRAEQGAGLTNEINSQNPELNPTEAQKEADKAEHLYKLEDVVIYQRQQFTIAGVGKVETGELIYDLADESGKIVHEDVPQELINVEEALTSEPVKPIEAVEPQSPIDNLNAILSGEKVVEAPTLEDQLKAAEQKLSTVKKDRDKKYRRYLDLKEKLDEIGSRDQVDVEGNVGNGMLAFEELDKEAKEKVNAARKEYEPLNEQVKELESKIEKLQGRIKDQKMNQQEMNFDEPVEPETKPVNELGTGKSVDSSPQQKPPVERSNYGNTNKIVSNERYEELKRRMKGKLGNLNIGFDPELLAIGTEMAAYHIEAGARKFADFAKRMIEDLGDGIRPYLKSFYQGSRYMPGMEPLSVEMDDPNSVNNFDVNNLNIQQDVLDRPDSSESDSKNPNDVQPDESSIPNEGRGSQQQRKANESRTPRTRNKRNGGKSGSGLFSDLFGEESDNGISQQDGTKKSQSNDAGNQQSTGDVIDSTEGLSDLDSERPNTDTQDNQSNGEQAETFAERTRKRIEQQKRAESIKNKSMDINNIRETLPMLLPEQQDDVLKAETRFFSKDHNTGPLAYGKGMLFTNGTGTGKTYTGLGIIKRFTKEGKNNILIVVPSQEKVSDWAKDGKNLLLDITPLEDTSTSGEGVNVTTYANFVNNEELQKRDFDLVVFDESHRIMENKDGEYSGSTSKFRSLANVTESYALNRIESVTPEYIEIRQLEKSIRDEETALGGSLDQPMEQYITRRSELDARIKKREELQKNYNNNILPKLKDRAKNAHQNTKVVLLSATPFKGHKNLRYANHVLFDWGTEITHQQASRVMSRVDAESRYFLDNFGAAYEWKNHQLQAKKNSNAEAIAMQEVQYAENLINMGVMSGRTIESDMDYARHFPVVTLENAEMFNDALNDIYSGAFQQLRQPAYSVFSDYNYTTKLFESLKASMYIPRIKQHLEMGRKVVLFHRRQQANVTPPFETIIRLTEEAISANEKTLESMKQNGWSENEIQEQADKILQMKIQKSGFLIEYSELFKFEKILNYAPAVQQIQEAFGDQVMFFNGSVSKQEKSRAVKEFNNDNSNVKIIMIQEEAGKEGISLHDTTGKHQRVLANLSLPISSTTALQIEGRIYRIGNESNAIFEYPLIGLDQEIRDFGSKINKKLSTTENLAIGDQSRDLLRSFSDGVLFNTSTDAPNSEQGIGGREYDRRQQEAMSEFRKAILVYHGNQKQRGTRDSREGVDYYATPEPVGQKMIEWLGLRPGEVAMEPSAGHGAIAMWIPDRANSLVVEPSFKLFSKLNARAGGGNRRMINDTFENLDIINKVDGVAMNPPFGTAGKTAMDHVEKAFKHLHDGGRIVALIPRGKMDERLDKFLYGENEKGKLLNPNAHLVGEILLPSITFDQAGTKVSTRLVVIDKTDNPVESVRHDLTFAETIEELFDAIENINMPERPEKIEPETVADNSFTEQWEQKNSRTGEAMYMVKFRGLVDNDTFSKARGIASKNNGRYSSFKSKADNVRAGFAFSTKEDADKFNSDVASLNKEDAAFKIVGENLPATININGVERPTTNSEGKPIATTEAGIRNFYKWFGESVTVNKKGQPVVYYHSTLSDFSAFSKDSFGSNMDTGTLGTGFYFSQSPENATNIAINSNRARITDTYTERNTSNDDLLSGVSLMPAYLRIENPAYPDTPFLTNGDNIERSKQITDKYKRKGHDGLVMEVNYGGTKVLRWGVVYDPSQIKSATGNSGEFSSDTDDIRFKINTYYSPAERALETLKQEKGTPDQMKAMLMKNGAKEAEFEWMGWDEFVSDKKTISKADIQQWIDENRIEIQEVEKGSVKPMATMANISEVKFSQYGSGSYLVSYRMGEDEGVVEIGTYEAGNEQEAKEKALERINNSESDYVSQATKFSQYVLPGGENYKELLLTMPATHYMYDINKVKIEETNTFWMFYDKDGELITGYAKDHNPTKEDVINTFKSNFKIDNKDVFQSSHFDESNILAHIRFNERTVNGERVLFIEEWQADKGQEWQKLKKLIDSGKATQADIDRFNFLDKNFPFNKTSEWLPLAMRRMMRYAAENGFDRIAWTNGEQQAERYDLSKQIESVEYFDTSGRLIAYNKEGNSVINEAGIEQNKVEDYIGKEATKKLFENITEERNGGRKYELKGEQLSVGGEGMKAFYDKIVPTQAGKLVKPFGVKVESIDIKTLDTSNTKVETTEKGNYRLVDDKGNTLSSMTKETGDGFSKADLHSELVYLAKRYPTMNATAMVQSIPVNQEMREVLAAGIPFYKIIGEKGAANLDKAEEATIRMDNLRVAREMEATKTPKEIRMATGWEKGVDGLWRYEVPDGKYKRNIFTIIKEKTKGLTLSDVWVDDYLFKAYPQLKSIPFDIAPIEKGTNGFYDGEKIVLNETLVTDDETQTREKLIRSILIHEIQHAIQVIEGFARGGNESQMKTPNDALQKIASPFSFPKLNKEDRAKAKELTKSKGLRFSQSFYFDVISDDADTIDDAIERLEILNKVSPNETYKTLINALELKLMEMGGTNVAFEKYRRLAGEVEARNASTRMNMTAEERRQTLLSETADVAPKDQIILMDAIGNQQSSGMSLEDAQWLSDTLTGVFNVEGTEGKTPTVVVASTKDLIEKLPGYAKQLTAYQVSGINTGDKVYINMEHVKSKEQFVKTWLHEHIHQITIDNYTENGIERFYNSLPAEVKGVLRSGYSGKSNLIKGLEIIAHYTEVLLDSVGLENLMNGNFDLSLVPESVRPILGEHLEIITYGNYQNNRENQLNDSRNDRGTTKGLQTTTARAGYQRDGSIRNTRRGNEDRAAFRITDDVSPLRDVVDAKLRKAVVKIGNRQLGEGFRFKVQENWQDSHIAVKHFLDVLRTNGVVIEDFNDYYLQVTQVPGRTDAQVDHYERMFHKPLMEAIGALQKQGMSYRDVENYAIMKHGIERNEYMRNQEAKIYSEKKVKKPTLKEQELDIDGSVMDEYRAALQDAYESKLISLSDKDYSGITAVAEEVEMTAEEYVAFIEGRITEQAINNFWTAVNNATNNSLEQAFKAGSISKATYEDLKSRYQFYIPLRGFDQEIAEDRYDYAPDMGTYYSLPMISAKGRRSRSENPFAYIWQMNQSAITFANRNLLNQSIKRLSAKDAKGLLTAKKAWYMLTGEIDGVKQWELREPEYSPDWKQYQKNIETFEEEMQELEEKGFASQRGGKLNLGLFTKPKQATQHTVHVMQNGVEYVIYFNADPAVSRAINGSNRTIANPGRVETFVRNASRTMAANFTTRNPVFVLSNFSRDFLYAASTLPAKESAAYAAKFVKNIPLVAASLKRAIKGKPDMTNPIDQLAVEYILNGGKTGYSSIVELQKTQKRIERDLRRHGKSSKAEALLKGIQAANEFAENITRLAAYVTSKQEGRSIIQSISDAKELTVNFNRNGAGGYGASFIKSYWLFVNAGIQAMANFYSIAKNHPGKTAAVIATYMAWGVIQPLLISMLGDDDDLEEYFKMSDWERQNNLIFPTGAGFIKIPLPHELRVFHAMGDNIAQTIFGYKDAGETIADTAMSFADLIPISPAGAIDASWVEMLPDAIKPLAQIHFTNTNFMGGRIVDEYKTRSEVMPGYRMARTNKKGEVLSPSFVVGVTKFLDHMTGGDGTQKGLVSMNPDEVNHLLRGYFGGLYTMAVQFGGIAYSGYEWSKGGDLKVKFKDTPLKAFYTSTDELNEKNSGLNKNFYRIKNEAENVLEAGKDYIKRSSNGEFDAIELDKKLEEINYHFYYEMNERFIKPVKTVEGKLDELPEEYIKEAEVIINSGKENLINFYHDGTKSGE